MTHQTVPVPHTEDHEIMACPHCGAALCAHYPAPMDAGEACLETTYITCQDHVLNCGAFGPCLGCGTEVGEVCVCGRWPVSF